MLIDRLCRRSYAPWARGKLPNPPASLADGLLQTRSSRVFSPFVIPQVAALGAPAPHAEVPTGLNLQPLIEASFAEADRRAAHEQDDAEGADLCSSPLPPLPLAEPAGPTDASSLPICLNPPFSPGRRAADEPAEGAGLCSFLPPPQLLPLPLAEPARPTGAGSAPTCLEPPLSPAALGLRAGGPSSLNQTAQLPGTQSPASSHKASADRRRRTAAAQARKEARRTEKALSRTGSFVYKAKTSALPILDNLAATDTGMDIAKAPVALPGAYVGKRNAAPPEQGQGAPTLSCLLKRGFVYHPWDGR